MPSTLGTFPVADPQYVDIWHAAIKEYEKATQVPLPSNTAHAISRKDALQLIEDEQKQFAEFRSKGHVGPVVDTIFGMVESLAQAAGEGISVVSLGIVCMMNLTC